ncbi:MULTISPECIES: hypothetical protein [Nonomuraea]|uniref:Uncharacterized protein n=1 Tax=Nonomuraea mangrovi TaxID=2316207 RepID=A0ABW4SKE4_9ACTN
MIARTGAALLLVPWIWIALSGELRGLPPVAFAAYVSVLVLAVASAVLGWATKPGSPPAGLVGRWDRERMQVAVIAQWLLAIFIAASLIAYVVLPE